MSDQSTLYNGPLKVTQEDIDQILQNAEIGKPIKCILPPNPNATNLECVLNLFFPPGLEDLVPSIHRELVISTREEAKTSALQALSEHCPKNEARLNIIIFPLLKGLIEIIPNLSELSRKTSYIIQFQEIMAHNSAMSKKYEGKVINICKNCQTKKICRKCTGCKAISYCSVACQKQDWSLHKELCIKSWNV